MRSEAIRKHVHAYLLRHGIEFQGMDNYLTIVYAKSGLINKAQILFGESNDLSRDQATWNIMICGNAQNGLIEEDFFCASSNAREQYVCYCYYHSINSPSLQSNMKRRSRSCKWL